MAPDLPSRHLESVEEQIMRWFCACSAYPDDPGSVVCWKCEQPLAEVDADRDLNSGLVQNLLLLCNRYRKALEAIESDAKRPELANAHHLGGVAMGALDGRLPR